MPIAVRTEPTGKKRKRPNQPESARQRQKSNSPSDSDEQKAHILLLEGSILESRKNYNDIVKLLEIARSDANDHKQLAAVALCRVFCRLIASGRLTEERGSSKSDLTIINWLEDRKDDFRNVLMKWLEAEDESMPSVSLTLILRLLKEEATLSRFYRLMDVRFVDIIRQLTLETCQEKVVSEFIEKYVLLYADVRYWTLNAIGTLFPNAEYEGQAEKAMSMLLRIKPSESDSLLCDDAKTKKPRALQSQKAQMHKAQSAWTGLLQQKLTKSQRKRVLEAIPGHIAPSIVEPEILMDFLTDSIDVGGSTALMALSGIFYLIQGRNLDYPQFYRKLYSMLDEQIMHSKHRSRFFRLLETFLESTHLPAVMVASFIKRMARLALCAPPSGIVVVVPFIYNLLQNHPTCTFMIHRTTSLPKGNEHQWGDPFRSEEQDPMATVAIESSLWEIVTLQSHYHPNVAAIAKIISEPFTKHAYNLEDFLDHSYDTVR